MGSAIEILRQRYFIDHKSETRTFITEEYTIIARDDDIDNIFLEVPRFLINLRIFDSDEEGLPLIPNDYTFALLENRIERLSGQEKSILENLYDDLRNHRKYMLWIKMPPTKKLQKDQLRIITLEYDAEKVKNPSKKLELDFPSHQTHNVFYVIRTPEDYEFENKDIEIIEKNGRKFKYKGNNEKDDPIYLSEGFDSIAITKKSEISSPMKISYSFRPDRGITKFPVTLAGLLSLPPIMILFYRTCGACIGPLPPNASVLFDHQIEIGLGIFATSLVIPTLINNQRIRNSLKTIFYLPIILALLLLLG
ncbi:MAG: hypothetical protein KGI27_04690 [Thaumarchaeota archaeon]|nr:hypothetical protein [Nitrososphaerota archaeon]